MSKSAPQELRLNVSYFYRDEESRRLITAEEATQLNITNEDDFYPRGEKFYEDDEANEEVVGVINWLHYPIGDLALRKVSHTNSTHH
ncbi:hypothetical protein ANCDUO_11488 [Ancylostoma duodenale]|uniref:Uncharacterized protein n=1 Tax=Ancylostoma duodenale TaxID=51022 RepID=A0A0C2GMP6_9BILA|nr:hypothetical protein ANCDUO_11488 [Ancylostoma duodenale]